MEVREVITIKDVHKSFKSHRNSNTLKDILVSPRDRSRGEREVLKGLTFSVRAGETIGLIGKNGSGKSTTLKLLSRILHPDSGEVTVQGKVASLIELGAGFHPDMSGRENIYINASIFGIKRKETDKILDDIISFSELEEFIDEPVKTYSSGMYMRLAFSVAVNVKPDILLIDEILAVGDAKFQSKCFSWLEEMKARGVTIIIVSHSYSQVERICDRAIWIENGVVRKDGFPYDVCNSYLYALNNDGIEASQDGNALSTDCTMLKRTEYDISGDGELKSIQIISRSSCEVEQGQKLTIRLNYCMKRKMEKSVLQIIIHRNDGRPVSSGFIKLQYDNVGDYSETYELDTSLLTPDSYKCQFVLIDVHPNGYMEKLDSLDNIVRFRIYNNLRWDLDTWGNTKLKICRCEEKA